jgi:hypothetical protein
MINIKIHYLVSNNTFKINNNCNKDFINKKANDIIIPAYKRKEYLNDESLLQSKSGNFFNNKSSSNLRKPVSNNNNNIISSSNFNTSSSNYNNYQVMINFIPCINCNNMISIDDIGNI